MLVPNFCENSCFHLGVCFMMLMRRDMQQMGHHLHQQNGERYRAYLLTVLTLELLACFGRIPVFPEFIFLHWNIPNCHGSMSSPTIQFTSTSTTSNSHSNISNIRSFRVENQYPSAKTQILLALLKLWALSRRLDTADMRPLLHRSEIGLKIGTRATFNGGKNGGKGYSWDGWIGWIAFPDSL